MSPRIVVTGGAGFIGSHLVRRLLRGGNEVVVLDDFSTGLRTNLPRSGRLTCCEGSVLARGDVRAACRDADLIVHLAAIVGVRLAYAEKSRAYAVAATGTENVLRAGSRQPVVLFSSSSVYGLHASEVSESSTISPEEAMALDGGECGYVSGKLAMERAGAAAGRAGRTVLTLRPFNVVGPRQLSAYGMVVPTFIDRALAGAPLQVYGDGTQTRSFSDVATFVDCTVRLLALLPSTTGESVFNVGTTSPTSVNELAELVIRVTGSASPIEHLPYASVFPRGHDVLARYPAIGKLESAIGPVRWRGLPEIVRECVRARRGSREPARAAVAGSLEQPAAR